MDEALIESGAAKVPAGKWLMGRLQPAAALGPAVVRSQRGFIVPDRAAVLSVETTSDAWCASADRPFLTRLSALPDESLCLVSGKLLVAPAASRVKARMLKLVPMSFRRATPVTEFRLGWAVAATKGRVSRVVVEDGRTLSVRPESLVAWIGKDPTGYCPKLSVWDILLPRGPKSLSYSFHGPCVVWFEGAQDLLRERRHPWPTR